MFYEAKPNAWGFPVGCYASASQDDISTILDAKQVNGTWIWVDGGIPFTPDQHFKVYKLAGSNWTGTATTYDDTTGEKSERGRNFQYCLFETNGPQILCGGPIYVMALSQPASVSTLPEILAVLKTIEFVDQPVNKPAPSDPTAEH
ncbi:MAG: hypothetical protein ABI114_13030 [Rhodanobacter sp.]